MPVEAEAVSSIQWIALVVSMLSCIVSMVAIWLSVKASQRVRKAEWDAGRGERRVWQSSDSADLPG